MKKLLVSLTAVIALSLLSFSVSAQANPDLLIFGEDFVCEAEAQVQYISLDQSDQAAIPERWEIMVPGGAWYCPDLTHPRGILVFFPPMPEGSGNSVVFEIRAIYEGNNYASKTITMYRSGTYHCPN